MQRLLSLFNIGPALQGPPAFWRFVRRSPHWILLSVAYGMAWYFPFSLAWRLLNPGLPVPDGMDGPISWNWRWWLQASSPLSYQLLVPLGVLTLALQRRAQLGERWHSLSQRPRSPRARLGAHAVLVLGCAILLISHLVHVISLAVLGLQLIGVGVVATVYGPQILRALSVPLLFWLLMFMPPETLPAKAEEKLMIASARGAASLLQLQKRPTTAEGWTLVEGDAAIQVSPASSGGALASATLVFLLWQGLYTRRRVNQILLSLAIGGALSLSLNVVRVGVVGRLNPGSSETANRINALSPWWLVPVSIGLTLLVLAGLRRIRLGGVESQINNLSRQAARPLDRALDTSGKAISRATGRLGFLGRPFELLARGLETLLVAPFRLMGQMSQRIEKQLRRWERARQKRKRGH